MWVWDVFGGGETGIVSDPSATSVLPNGDVLSFHADLGYYTNEDGVYPVLPQHLAQAGATQLRELATPGFNIIPRSGSDWTNMYRPFLETVAAFFVGDYASGLGVVEAGEAGAAGAVAEAGQAGAVVELGEAGAVAEAGQVGVVVADEAGGIVSAADALAAPESLGIYGADVVGPSEALTVPADAVVAGSAGGTGAATIPPAASPVVTALESLGVSSLSTVVRSYVTPKPPRQPMPAVPQPLGGSTPGGIKTPESSSLLPWLIGAGVVAKVLLFS